MAITPTTGPAARPAIELIRALDARLLVAGARLKNYRATEQTVSVVVQQGVVDRLLAERFELMKERDRG